MKKILLVIGVVLGTAASTHAQRNAIKLNTVSLLLQTGSVFYEHQLASNRSVNVGAFVTHYVHTFADASYKTQWNGFGLTGEYRFYPGNSALKGFFVGPYLRFQNYNYTNTRTDLQYFGPGPAPITEDRAKLTTFGGGGVLGWKGLIGSHFVIEPFLGIGYAAGQVDNLDDNHGTLVVENGIRGLETRLGLNIGFAFGGDAK